LSPLGTLLLGVDLSSAPGDRLTSRALYDEARRLNTTSRSGMSTEQLGRAVTEAREE
jgi:hypothetical protein